jgi:hypothetical protein
MIFYPADAVFFGDLAPWFFKVGFGICKIIIVLDENTRFCLWIFGG